MYYRMVPFAVLGLTILLVSSLRALPRPTLLARTLRSSRPQTASRALGLGHCLWSPSLITRPLMDERASDDGAVLLVPNLSS